MKPGRNDPCPCGSGKKYKKCCQKKSGGNPSAPASIKAAPPTAAECNQLVALLNAGHYVELERLAYHWVEQYPETGFVWKVLGAALQAQGKDELSAKQKAAEFLPDDADAHYNLGNTLNKLGQLEGAVASYHRALEIKPDYAEAHNNAGNALKNLGRLDAAAASYRRALEIKPDYIEARLNLAQAGKVKAGDENLAALAGLAEAARIDAVPLPVKNAVFLHFALGKCYDDIGDHEKAFPHFIEGCRLKRATFDYDPNPNTQYVASIMRNFDAELMDRLRGGGVTSSLSIFVLGMPRSGTTLTEQIIASHPQVYGAGELPDLMEIMRRDVGGGRVFPNNLHLLDQGRLAAMGAEYVSRLQRRAPEMRHITDKMPSNFYAVGPIHLMLPNARIIHVRRNPVDTCLSCFTQLFVSEHKFTYDLAELGRYYIDYFHLMQHWREVLPTGAFLDVQYEDIVADKEGQARRIIEYCGLEWNDACLDFHKTKRAVHTASAVQVRQPMYQSSVERWRKYERFLGPLLDALGDIAPQRG